MVMKVNSFGSFHRQARLSVWSHTTHPPPHSLQRIKGKKVKSHKAFNKFAPPPQKKIGCSGLRGKMASNQKAPASL